MRLTRYTDYSLRVLIHLGMYDDRLCSIAEIARTYDISHNHLMKVVNALAHDGFVETVRGRSGGIRLARAPHEITIGDVVRRTEDGFQLADCSSCAIAPACGLTGVLNKGMQAMLDVFDAHTLADLLVTRDGMRLLLERKPAAPALAGA